jgi:hypothetical protein
MRVSSGSQRHAFIVAAANEHGVKAVRDHLVYEDPMSGTTVGPPDGWIVLSGPDSPVPVLWIPKSYRIEPLA